MRLFLLFLFFSFGGAWEEISNATRTPLITLNQDEYQAAILTVELLLQETGDLKLIIGC